MRWRSYLSRTILATTLVAGPSGCWPGFAGTGGSDTDTSGSSGTPPGTCGDGVCDADEDPATCVQDCVEGVDGGSLSACATDLTGPQVQDTLAIVFDFKESCHEMIVCGGLVGAIAGAVIEVLITLLQDPSASALPPGYSFDAGTYHATTTGFSKVSMDVRFYLGDDYQYGPAGTLIEENLFVLSSYLLGAKVTLKGTFPDVSAEVSFTGTGPLVELLGRGPSPTSPLVFSLLDPPGAELGKLRLDAVIHVEDTRTAASITYDVNSPQTLVQSIVTGAPLDLMMVGADGTRDDLMQQLAVNTWDVAYVDDAIGALTGTIAFRVEGQHFPFLAELHYPSSNEPEISVTCAP